MPKIQRAIVVGASRGLGWALAETLAHRGSQVVATVRSNRPTDPRHEAGGIEPFALDLDHAADHDRLATAFPAGQFDLLFVNAGVSGPDHQRAEQASVEEVGALFTTNAVSPIALARRALPLVRPGGIVAFMSSRMGSVGLNDDGALELYRASKAALNSLSRSFAVKEALPAGRGVLVLHPGWVQTDMGGTDAPLTALESVSGLCDVIAAALDRPAHAFRDYRGIELNW